MSLFYISFARTKKREVFETLIEKILTIINFLLDKLVDGVDIC